MRARLRAVLVIVLIVLGGVSAPMRAEAVSAGVPIPALADPSIEPAAAHPGLWLWTSRYLITLVGVAAGYLLVTEFVKEPTVVGLLSSGMFYFMMVGAPLAIAVDTGAMMFARGAAIATPLP